VSTSLYGKASSYNKSDQWALQPFAVYCEDESYLNPQNASALLESDYPYLSMPSTFYEAFKANLTQLGFVCFRYPYTQLSVCEISNTCDRIKSYLPDF